MFGWVGELASAFASAGLPGLIILALLIVIVLLLRTNHQNSKHLVQMHHSTITALNQSSTSHLGVAKVLSRIEAILGLKNDDS